MFVLNFVKAAFVRLVFTSYCFIASWRVVVTYNDNDYWILTGLLFGLLLETIMTLVIRKGREWDLFSPSIFFFLVPAVPCIWLMELQLMKIRVDEASRLRNATDARTGAGLGVSISIPLDEFGWVLALEQSLLFILIIGRWILPKGDLSRDQLSQLLLVHVGMAADIMEIFELFKEEKFIDSQQLIYPALSLWTVSLLQYCLVISSIKARKTRFSDLDESNNEEARINVKCCQIFGEINVDIVGIITSILMQDLPFLVFRLYLLIALGVISHMMIFFTCKNALVVLLQLYRLVTIYKDSNSDDSVLMWFIWGYKRSAESSGGFAAALSSLQDIMLFGIWCWRIFFIYFTNLLRTLLISFLC